MDHRFGDEQNTLDRIVETDSDEVNRSRIFFKRAWDHIIDIDGAFQSTVTACGDYVALFDGLISHFEKPAP